MSFGRSGSARRQQLLEMRHVVVAEDLLLAMRLAHALDHRIVVPGIRQDQAIGHQPRQRRDAGLVRDVAGSEDQRRFLAVQIGELALQLDQRMIVAGDVAGAAGAGSHPRRGLDHGADHFGVLAHAEIVVGAPDHDVLRPVGGVPDRMREPSGDAFEVGKDAIAALAMQPVERIGEIAAIIDSRAIVGIVHRQAFPAIAGIPRYWNSVALVLEAFQGVCRGLSDAVRCRVIDRTSNLRKCPSCSPTARRAAAGLEPRAPRLRRHQTLGDRDRQDTAVVGDAADHDRLEQMVGLGVHLHREARLGR